MYIMLEHAKDRKQNNTNVEVGSTEQLLKCT